MGSFCTKSSAVRTENIDILSGEEPVFIVGAPGSIKSKVCEILSSAGKQDSSQLLGENFQSFFGIMSEILIQWHQPISSEP
jgi:hypothetical protein